MNHPWDVLVMEPTRDKKAIKKAYAKALKQSHPETDPEAYQCLREAYDAALLLCAENIIPTAGVVFEPSDGFSWSGSESHADPAPADHSDESPSGPDPLIDVAEPKTDSTEEVVSSLYTEPTAGASARHILKKWLDRVQQALHDGRQDAALQVFRDALRDPALLPVDRRLFFEEEMIRLFFQSSDLPWPFARKVSKALGWQLSANPFWRDMELAPQYQDVMLRVSKRGYQEEIKQKFSSRRDSVWQEIENQLFSGTFDAGKIFNNPRQHMVLKQILDYTAQQHYPHPDCSPVSPEIMHWWTERDIPSDDETPVRNAGSRGVYWAVFVAILIVIRLALYPSDYSHVKPQSGSPFDPDFKKHMLELSQVIEQLPTGNDVEHNSVLGQTFYAMAKQYRDGEGVPKDSG